MRSFQILLILAAMSVAGPALAEDFSYTYLQVELLGAELRSSGESTRGDGASLSSAIELGTSRFFISTDTATIAYLDSDLGLRLESDSLGLGAHTALGSTIDVVGGLSLEHLKSKVTGVPGSDSEWGWGAAIGLRGQVGEKFQWTAGLRYQDIGDFKSITGFNIGGHYYLSPAFALGLQLSGRKHDADALDARESVLSIAFRYHFREGGEE